MGLVSTPEPVHGDLRPADGLEVPEPAFEPETPPGGRRRALEANQGLSPSRRRNLARMYGLTTEDFLLLLDHQDGRCPMCLKKFTSDGRRVPQVEENHHTGEVTMLACYRDNHDLLGMFGRDPAFYRRVADALENPPAREALGRRHYVPGAPPRPEEPQP